MLILQGILLFLFIPLVLFLYLSFPFGTLPSIIIGALIMFGHRFIARPYMTRNIDKRCVWSGRTLKSGDINFILKTKNGDLIFRSYSSKDKENALRFFNFVYSTRFLLKALILGTLAWYLLSLIAGEINDTWRYLPRETFVSIFKVIIAVTVVSASFLYRLGGKTEPVNGVFPAHNFFLLGIRWILWVFRIVGIWWIVQWVVNI